MRADFRAFACVAALTIAGAAVAVPVQFADNGHYYEYVESRLTWDDAVAAAAASTFMGMKGYLVTVTSEAESVFIYNSVTSNMAWAGGSDSGEEGVWKWNTGPEAGTIFWANGSTVTYAHWGEGVPDNWDNEDFLVLNDLNWSGPYWNDYYDQNGFDYVVEYSKPIPEPSTYALFVLGLACLGLNVRRR